MPANNLTIGRDCQVVVLHPLAPGGRLDLPVVDMFEADQNTNHIKVIPINGIPIMAETPSGWTGRLTVTRTGNSLGTFFTAMEQVYYAGGNVTNGTVYQYITETDGSVSTYRFDSCAFFLPKGGSFAGDKEVKITLEFHAATRSVA